MKQYLKQWVVAAAVFTVVDLVWLGFIASSVYDHYIGNFLADEPNLVAAGVFYGLFIFGLVHFAIGPAVKAKSQQAALKQGALFGFFTYMTYELTNYAVIEDWPFGIVPIDIAWGTVLGAATSLIAYKILMQLK